MPFWCAHKFLVRPKKGPTMLKSESSWNLVPLLASNIKRGWEGRAESSGIRLGRGTTYLVTRSCIKNQPTSWLVYLRNHYWCWDKPWATQTHLTHHGSDLGEATTFPHIVFSALLRRTHIRMALCPETPKVESWNCPEIIPVWTPGTSWGHNSFLKPPIGTRSKENL
jgi:hypothetical protein